MRRKDVIAIVIVAVVYFITGRLGLAMTFPGDHATPIWPPSGICLAAVTLCGYRLWPGVAIGALLTVWSSGEPAVVAIGITIGVTSESLLGAFALRSVGFDPRLERLRDVMALVVVALVCPLIVAAIGVNTVLLAGEIGGNELLIALLGWWLTGLVSMLVISPLVFVAYARRAHLIEVGAGWMEALLLCVVLGGLASVTFIPWHEGLNRLARPYMMFLPLIWAAVRFGPFGSVLTSIAITAFAQATIQLELHGDVDIWAIQPYFAIISVTGLSLAALVASRRALDRYKGAVLDAALDAVVTIDDTGTIIEFNHRAEQLFDYRAEEIIGKPVSETLIPKDLRDAHLAAFHRYLETGTTTMLGRRTRLPAMRKDGTEFPAEVSIVRVALAGPARFTGFIRDVTIEVRAEERMRRAQQDLEREVAIRTAELSSANTELESRREQDTVAQQLAHVGSFELDLGAHRLTWSDELYRIYGLSPDTFRPTYEEFIARVHADDRELVQHKVAVAIAESSPFTFEERIVRPDGSVRYLMAHGRVLSDATGRPLRVLGSCQDITDQRKAEAQRDRSVRLVEFSDDAMIGIDPQLRIETWNSGAAKLFGCTASEAIGQSAMTLVPPEEVDAARERLNEILEGRHLAQYECVHMRLDGSRFDASVSSAAIRNGNGKIIGIAKVVRDISQRTAIDARVRASLAEKEVLLREIHHRVKNNLQVISSFLNLQISKLSSADARRATTESQSRIQSMALVHQLLYQSKDLASIDFGDYLRALADRLLKTYRPDGNVSVDVESSVRLDIDPAITCGLIVNELLANALTHAFPDNRPGHVYVSLTHEQGNFVLTVIDDGVGIPEKLSIDKTQSFGLKITRTLSQQLGGTLVMTRGNGTIARIEFPAPVAGSHRSAA